MRASSIDDSPTLHRLLSFCPGTGAAILRGASGHIVYGSDNRGADVRGFVHATL
jgi:hypothetical protein